MTPVPTIASHTPIVPVLELPSLWETGKGEGRGSSGIAAWSYPHPALRATFSRWEKEKHRRLEPLSRRRSAAQSPKWGRHEH